MVTDLEKQTEEHCRFCNPPEKERILYYSKSFYVMLSLGPIVEGYLLIISRNHLDCSAVYDDELGKEFDTLAEEVKKILKKVYGSYILYEHGRDGSSLQFSEGNEHCFHAHMHCIPTSVKLNQIISREFEPIKLSSYSEFRGAYKTKFAPYLFVEDDVKNIYFIDKEIKRQYLRYHLANELSVPELWDWVRFQGWGKIQSAKEKLKPQFDSLSKLV